MYLEKFFIDYLTAMSLQKLSPEIVQPQQFPSSSLRLLRQKQVWQGLGKFYYCRNQPARTIAEHAHSHHALLISLSGTTWLNMPSNGYRQLQKLPVGGIAITPATVVHSAIVDEGSEFIILYLNPEFVTRSVYGLAQQHQSTLKPLLVEADVLIQSIGMTLKTEVELSECDRKSPNKPVRLYIESLFTTLCAHLLRRYAVHNQHLPAYGSRISSQKLSRVLDYIDIHLSDVIKLEDLADTLEMSRYYFLRLFKQSVGITPYQYILQQRVERAKQLLKLHEIVITDIALQCGFANQSHFTRHFRKFTGVTPAKYRQDLCR